jgi:3',5'-cyclic-AMP phosphodiesterase
MIRFIHLSDTHIARDRSFTNYGHKPYPHLERLVELLNELPTPYDFILHSGDVVEDGSVAAYENARDLLKRLNKPIYYLNGNHDDAPTLQRVLMSATKPTARLDYAFTAGGVQFVALDSKGPLDPMGYLYPDQIEFLKSFCEPEGYPLVVWVHHQPLRLGVHWLDERIFTDNNTAMHIENYGEFQAALRPIRDRVRGVFFGHIHRGLQHVHDGILYSSAPSTFGQLQTYPNSAEPAPAPDEAPGYCLVTVSDAGTQVQQYTFARPS